MTEDEVKSRLDTLSGSQTSSKKGSMLLPFIGGVGTTVLVLGAGAYGVASYVNADRAPSTSLATSEPSAFQEDSPLSSFRIAAADPAVSAIEPPKTDLETERLKRQLSELKNQIESLKNQPKEVQTIEVENTDKLDEMAARLTEIESLSAEKQRQLDDALRKEQRLMAELDGERLLREQATINQANAEIEAEERRQRLALLEQRRAEAKALQDRQIKSGMVAFKNSSGGSAGADAKERYQGDEAFLHNGTPAKVTQSEVIANPSNTVAQGTIIEATLETAISSELQGNVTAIISYDVWSLDLSQVLIPRGSKLFGRYSSNVKTGQKRVLVAWDRILTTDNQSVNINAYGNDRLGRSGSIGKVDNHFFERFGSAALISAIGAVPTLVAAESNDDLTSETLENVGNDFGEAVGQVMADYLRIKPTIYVDHGDTILVTVNTDLELF